MKRVVSVSIGSSSRNHRIETELLGETFLIERIGTDGDLKRAIEIVRELDGQVDAIGLGGIDLYIYSGGRRYRFRMPIALPVRPKNSRRGWQRAEELTGALGCQLHR